MFVRIRFDLSYLFTPRWDTGRVPKELTELVEGGVVEPCRCVDLGCGRGHAVRYLQVRGFDAWGIDASYLAIRRAKRISSSMGLPPNFIRGDVLSHVPKEKYSLALDIGFYHTLSDKERKSFTKEGYRRFLADNGRLLLWCKNEYERNYVRVSRQELLSFFSGVWTILELKETNLLEPIEMDYHFLHASLKPRMSTQESSSSALNLKKM